MIQFNPVFPAAMLSWKIHRNKIKGIFFPLHMVRKFYGRGLTPSKPHSVHNIIYFKAIPCSHASASRFQLQGRQAGKSASYVLFQIPLRMSPLKSVAFSESQNALSHGSQPDIQWECWANDWKSDPNSSSADAPAARGEDYITPPIFSGWVVIVTKVPGHSVVQDALIYCQKEQVNKTVYITKDWIASILQPC